MSSVWKELQGRRTESEFAEFLLQQEIGRRESIAGLDAVRTSTPTRPSSSRFSPNVSPLSCLPDVDHEDRSVDVAGLFAICEFRAFTLIPSRYTRASFSAESTAVSVREGERAGKRRTERKSGSRESFRLSPTPVSLVATPSHLPMSCTQYIHHMPAVSLQNLMKPSGRNVVLPILCCFDNTNLFL